MFTSTSSKGHGLWLVDFNPCCLFLCFIHVSSTSKEQRLFNRQKAGDLTQINIIQHSSSWTTNAFHSNVQSTFFILVFFTSPLMFHQLQFQPPVLDHNRQSSWRSSAQCQDLYSCAVTKSSYFTSTLIQHKIFVRNWHLHLPVYH